MENLYQNRFILTRKGPGGSLAASNKTQDSVLEHLQLGGIFEWQVIMTGQVENVFGAAADG